MVLLTCYLPLQLHFLNLPQPLNSPIYFWQFSVLQWSGCLLSLILSPSSCENVNTSSPLFLKMPPIPVGPSFPLVTPSRLNFNHPAVGVFHFCLIAFFFSNVQAGQLCKLSEKHIPVNYNVVYNVQKRAPFFLPCLLFHEVIQWKLLFHNFVVVII